MVRTRRWLFLASAAAMGCADEAQTVTFGTTQPGLSSPAERSPRAAAGDDPLVTVSLTFDDTEDEQLGAAAVLEAHGLVGTFYVNSSRLHQSSAGADNWLSVADVQAMQQRGLSLAQHALRNNAAPADDGGSPLPPDTAQTLLAWLDHNTECLQALHYRAELLGWRSGILPEPALGGEPRLAA
jgi:hypothetical protein